MILLSSFLNNFIQLVGVLVIFGFVLVITYFATKWIGGFQKMQMHGRNLQVIESMQLAPNKYIESVKAGEVYLVIAVGKDEVTMLTRLTGEQLGITEGEMEEGCAGGKAAGAGSQETFQEILNRFREHFPKKQD